MDFEYGVTMLILLVHKSPFAGQWIFSQATEGQ